MTRPILLTVTCLAVCRVVLPAQVNKVSVEDEVVKEIKQLEAERSRNLVNGDADKQDQLLAPEFVEVGATGQVRTKAENIQGMKSGQTHWEAFDLSDLDVHVYGETAVVTGRLRRKGTSAGRDISGQSRYTRYYVRRQGRWQAIFQHGIPIREADNASAPGRAEQEILRLEEERRQAILHNDAAAMDRLLGEEFIRTDYEGSAHDRADELSLYKNNRRQTQSWQASDVKVHVYGDAAVVTERVAAKDVLDGQARDMEFRFTHVWAKRNGRWQLVARHGSHIPQPHDKAQDEAAIRKIVADSADAWNRRDAKALAAHISEDGDHINVNGAWRNGRAETEKALSAALATTRNNVSSSVAKLRFVTPDVAVVIVRREYTNDKESRKAISTSVLHKINGQWWNEAFQNTYVQPAADQPSEKKASDDGAERMIRVLDEQFEDAYKRGELASRQEMTGEDYVGIGVGGTVFTKTTARDFFKSRHVKTLGHEVTDRKIRVYGDTAVVTGTRHIQDTLDGKPRDEQHRYTRVWVKRNGRWQMVSFQATKITAP